MANPSRSSWHTYSFTEFDILIYFVGKIVQELLWPLNWCLLGLIAGYWLARRHRYIASRRAIVFSFLALAIPSLPIVSDSFVAWLESQHHAMPISAYPKAEAIVVLDGSIANLQWPRSEEEEVGDSRLLPVVRLFRLGKAPLVVVTGGIPYRDRYGKVRSHAEDMASFLVEWGIPRSAILLEDRSRNTQENAEMTAQILQERKNRSILLVTSAFHMRRSTAIFRNTGLMVQPVPVAHRITQDPGAQWGLGIFKPSLSALLLSTLAIKELIGYLVVGTTRRIITSQ